MAKLIPTLGTCAARGTGGDRPLAERIRGRHDFAPEWLRLVTQMVDPATNSLLVLDDDAQCTYERRTSCDGSKPFSFKSVGIQTQDRTTILKNYRNTRHTAGLVAADLLTSDNPNGKSSDDGLPLFKPVSCGRDGQAPVFSRLPTLQGEAFAIADHLANAHKEGFAWGDMAVLCADWATMHLCASGLAQRKLRRVRKRSGDYQPCGDAIQLMAMKVSNGAERTVEAPRRR